MWNKQGKDQRIKKIEKRDVSWEKKETKMRGYRNDLKRTGSPVERIPELCFFFLISSVIKPILLSFQCPQATIKEKDTGGKRNSTRKMCNKTHQKCRQFAAYRW